MLVLINTEKLVVLKVHEDMEALSYWAEILAPKDNTYIGELATSSLKIFNRRELEAILLNTSKRSVKGNVTDEELKSIIWVALDNTPIDPTSITTLKRKLGRTLQPITATPAPEKRSSTPTVRKTGPSLPRGGNKAVIWDVADMIWDNANSPKDKPTVLKLRRAIMDHLEGQGIKRTSASSELGKWHMDRAPF